MKRSWVAVLLGIAGLALVAIFGLAIFGQSLMDRFMGAPVKLGDAFSFGEARITVEDAGFRQTRNNQQCVDRGQAFPFARIKVECAAGTGAGCSLSILGQVTHESGSSWGSTSASTASARSEAKTVRLDPGTDVTVGFGVQGCWNTDNPPLMLRLRVEDTGEDGGTRYTRMNLRGEDGYGRLTAL